MKGPGSGSHVLVTDSLHRMDVFGSQFFAEFTDMHIDGPVADYNVGPPDPVEDLFAGKYLFRF